MAPVLFWVYLGFFFFFFLSFYIFFVMRLVFGMKCSACTA